MDGWGECFEPFVLRNKHVMSLQLGWWLWEEESINRGGRLKRDMENIDPQSFHGPKGEKNLQNAMHPHGLPNSIRAFWVCSHKYSISWLMTLELSYLGKGLTLNVP